MEIKQEDAEEEPEGAVTQVHVPHMHTDEQAGQVPNEAQAAVAEVHLPARDEDSAIARTSR